MAKVLMIQGTASGAGKSLVAAGLLRIMKQDGYRVAPFKSQNMALNSYVTPDGFEIGRAQAMQAEAAGIPCDVRMNPVLLKPTGNNTSQVIFMGEVVRDMSTEEYTAKKQEYGKKILDVYNSLASDYDIIIIEGAGSPAEINLNQHDFVNMGMAEMVNSPVFIVGDIDKGGVFASLYGTVELIPKDCRHLIKGTIINKFRGNISLLGTGLTQLEELTKVPCVGVIPYGSFVIDDEDSVTERLAVHSYGEEIDVAVIRLPHISNFTDFSPFELAPGVRVRYVERPEHVATPDLLIIPGTKNTMFDLSWMKKSGIAAEVRRYATAGNPVFGICGGYQMLGKSLKDPYGVEEGGEERGLGLLDIETVFGKEKTRKQTEGVLANVGGIFANLSGRKFSGYEIHMGESEASGNIVNSGNVYGTYIHGVFDTADVISVVVKALQKKKGMEETNQDFLDAKAYKETQYDLLADTVRDALDMDYVYKVIEEGIQD